MRIVARRSLAAGGARRTAARAGGAGKAGWYAFAVGRARRLAPHINGQAARELRLRRGEPQRSVAATVAGPGWLPTLERGAGPGARRGPRRGAGTTPTGRPGRSRWPAPRTAT